MVFISCSNFILPFSSISRINSFFGRFILLFKICRLGLGVIITKLFGLNTNAHFFYWVKLKQKYKKILVYQISRIIILNLVPLYFFLSENKIQIKKRTLPNPLLFLSLQLFYLRILILSSFSEAASPLGLQPGSPSGTLRPFFL